MKREKTRTICEGEKKNSLTIGWGEKRKRGQLKKKKKIPKERRGLILRKKYPIETGKRKGVFGREKGGKDFRRKRGKKKTIGRKGNTMGEGGALRGDRLLGGKKRKLKSRKGGGKDSIKRKGLQC